MVDTDDSRRLEATQYELLFRVCCLGKRFFHARHPCGDRISVFEAGASEIVFKHYASQVVLETYRTLYRGIAATELLLPIDRREVAIYKTHVRCGWGFEMIEAGGNATRAHRLAAQLLPLRPC